MNVTYMCADELPVCAALLEHPSQNLLEPYKLQYIHPLMRGPIIEKPQIFYSHVRCVLREQVELFLGLMVHHHHHHPTPLHFLSSLSAQPWKM